MRLNNKGFTTVELIVSFALTMVVLGFLFQILMTLKDLYVSSGVRTELLTKQTIMSRKVNSELTKKTIVNIANCGDECLIFTFNDGSVSELNIDRTNNVFKYNDYTTKLVNESNFGSTAVLVDTVSNVATGNNNTIIEIRIPINNSLYKTKDFGLNIIYQYDNRTYTLGNFSFGI